MEALNRRQRSVMTAGAMVAKYLRSRGIHDERVMAAMERLPRHLFVPEVFREKAYSDNPLPIGDEQTISQPYIVAAMSQALELQGDEKVLEIGTGSGYQTALLARLTRTVFSIERIARLASDARRRIEELGIHNVSVRIGNGALGWTEYAPYDRILVTASGKTLPEPLIEQLREGGIMVVPLGSDPESQELFRLRKVGGTIERTFLCGCSFVPLVT